VKVTGKGVNHERKRMEVSSERRGVKIGGLIGVAVAGAEPLWLFGQKPRHHPTTNEL
jgi:hypothetical protein